MQLFVNDLTVIDFSYLCAERGIVGESLIVDVLLTGDLNEQSMVLDFGIVKKQIKAIIDDAVDHKLLLPLKENALTLSDSTFNNNHEMVDFVSSRGSYFIQSPSCAFAKIACEKITITAITDFLQAIIKSQLPTNVNGLTITLREEEMNGDYYHYTHGLKKHDGNCQRIAHGHRSKINLLRNNVRDLSLEKMWCQRWLDIYLASECDRIKRAQSQLSTFAMKNLTPDHHYFSYIAPQGRFDIAVHSDCLDVVDCDSTVELLADWIARQLKEQSPQDVFTVVAFEGVGKGAIASV